MAYTGAWIAATAAEEQRRKTLLAGEEEDMTMDTQDNLKEDWEFKIVRSESGAFGKPEALSRLVEEEAQAGWVMLEKFDDNRVRFRRPRSARSRDAYLPEGVDPYRTQYGRSSARSRLVAISAGLVILGGLIFGLLVSQDKALASSPAIWIVVAGLSLVVVMGVLVATAAKRG
jgi:hypothetical protein